MAAKKYKTLNPWSRPLSEELLQQPVEPGGTLELHFDNNIHLTDIAYTGNGLLPLWNAGIGKALQYGRVH